MDVKVKLFNTYCSPMYTAQLWWNHTVYSFHRLNVCYNNILRRLLRRPRYCSASGLFAECGIPNCKAVIRSLIYKFRSRLNESTNDVILAILSSDIRWTSRIRRYWVKTNALASHALWRYRNAIYRNCNAFFDFQMTLFCYFNNVVFAIS